MPSRSLVNVISSSGYFQAGLFQSVWWLLLWRGHRQYFSLHCRPSAATSEVPESCYFISLQIMVHSLLSFRVNNIAPAQGPSPGRARDLSAQALVEIRGVPAPPASFVHVMVFVCVGVHVHCGPTSFRS